MLEGFIGNTLGWATAAEQRNAEEINNEKILRKPMFASCRESLTESHSALNATPENNPAQVQLEPDSVGKQTGEPNQPAPLSATGAAIAYSPNLYI